MQQMSDTDGFMESKPRARDLLQRFVVCGNANNFPRKSAAETIGGEDDGEKIELSLGLSLNGRFGVDPQRGSSNILIRATSVADFVVSGSSKDETAAFSGLMRTCSLPAETEDEWRKRKELQSQRRLEAKRKRVEKLKNGRVVKERLLEVDRSSEECGRGEVVTIGSGGVEVKSEKVGLEGLNKGEISSQGSIGSAGTGSSGISEFESLPIRGINVCTDERSPASEQSLPEQFELKAAAIPRESNDNSSNIARSRSVNKSAKGAAANKDPNMVAMNMLADMPCVSTKGDGPDGKKIEGFLYRYKKGEEVKIVCVCHGNFLSPSDFVKHGGGGDVEHPLRHIVISTSSFY